MEQISSQIQYILFISFDFFLFSTSGEIVTTGVNGASKSVDKASVIFQWILFELFAAKKVGFSLEVCNTGFVSFLFS